MIATVVDNPPPRRNATDNSTYEHIGYPAVHRAVGSFRGLKALDIRYLNTGLAGYMASRGADAESLDIKPRSQSPWNSGVLTPDWHPNLARIEPIYDLIVVNLLIGSMWDEDALATLKMLAKALKRGGRLVMMDFMIDDRESWKPREFMSFRIPETLSSREGSRVEVDLKDGRRTVCSFRRQATLDRLLGMGGFTPIKAFPATINPRTGAMSRSWADEMFKPPFAITVARKQG